MASSHSAVLRILQKRPLISLGLVGATGVTSYAHFVEYQSKQDEKKVLPRVYNREALHQYWSGRPVSAVKRLITVVSELAPRLGAYVWDFHVQPSEDTLLQSVHAAKLREALTRLGPAFVKAGQQLSIRPDLVSPAVLKELQRLCDSVEPIDDDIALQLLKDELQCNDLNDLFDRLHLVASASLGQVYKANLVETGETVAIKVQRPDMLQNFSLDLYLLQQLGVVMDAFNVTFTHQAAFHKDLFDTFSRGSYSELDYEQEAANQIRFQSEFVKRNLKVKVPAVFEDLTTQRVITTEWIDGCKLSDAPQPQIKKLIPVGVELFLTQLLDIGAFHADPHPGNLYVTNDGSLCLLDFGLCAEVDEQTRRAMTKAIVHLLLRDIDSLVAEDAKELGFLPEDFDTSELKPIMTKILTTGLLESGSNLHHRKRKLMDISNELNEVFFRYPFSVPPFFALVTRGLGLLEGIALSGDENFDIFQASAPYARRRAMEIMGAHSFRELRKLTTAKTL
jgi:aarF domain-containing kinase